MDDLEFRLLNDFQRGFPLCRRPYRAMAEALGCSEPAVIRALGALRAGGKVSRIGVVFAPGRIGAATLAAASVPAERLPAVARVVNAFPEVNHNYEREHVWNLWFVATAPDETRLDRVLDEIEACVGCGRLLRLPMVEGYHIDLGFPLGTAASRAAAPVCGQRVELTVRERALAAALQEGLDLAPAPYAALAARAGITESEAIATLGRWIDAGVVKRIGLIVRHHELGYAANAMVVWDIPDPHVSDYGRRIAAVPYVTLCYRRARCLPEWRYNLYCMIHGTRRAQVLAQIAELEARCDLGAFPHEALFSRRRFKQAAARYVETAAGEPAHG